MEMAIATFSDFPRPCSSSSTLGPLLTLGTLSFQRRFNAFIVGSLPWLVLAVWSLPIACNASPATTPTPSMKQISARSHLLNGSTVSPPRYHTPMRQPSSLKMADRLICRGYEENIYSAGAPTRLVLDLNRRRVHSRLLTIAASACLGAASTINMELSLGWRALAGRPGCGCCRNSRNAPARPMGSSCWALDRIPFADRRMPLEDQRRRAESPLFT